MLFKINQQKIQLTNKELETFSTAIKLLELNSRPIHVLSTLLLTLSQRKQ
jgi:DNA polymerase-3 subunit delta'